ncbi:hypothetical protein SAMN05428938_7741 [Streptomyces sp. KS_5]|nr:hypothetical protein SAMN05428938_7741 [Streptomyces sp. KS_5]
MQVGEVVTRQDRRDRTSGEVTRAMALLGFTCHARPSLHESPRSPFQAASKALRSPGSQDA